MMESSPSLEMVNRLVVILLTLLQVEAIGHCQSTYQSKGGVIYSSQWTGSWVPADFCGGGPGDLDGSHFRISNLRISGSVVQGPEPTKCGSLASNATAVMI